MPGKRRFFPQFRQYSYIPAMQADPTAGGNRPDGCLCAWAERDDGWHKGDDNTRCPVHSSQPGSESPEL